VRHVRTREPGGTAVGEEIRRLLLHGGDMPARTELLLLLAARAALVEAEIRPALEAGLVVVSDRFGLSSLAYQSHGRGLDLEDVRRLHDFAAGGIRPDLTIVLEVPQTVAAARRSAGRPGEDRIEAAGGAFHRRVSEAYRLLARTEENVVVLDGTSPAAAVHGEIVRLVRGRFPETFGGTTG
jgi:dTMP kinase